MPSSSRTLNRDFCAATISSRADLETPGTLSASSSRLGGKLREVVRAQEIPAISRGLPSTRPRRKRGKVLALISAESTSTITTVMFLSASGTAASTASIAPGPRSFSLAAAFWTAGSLGPVPDRMSDTSLSARKFVKKLIQPTANRLYLHDWPNGAFRRPPVTQQL